MFPQPVLHLVVVLLLDRMSAEVRKYFAEQIAWPLFLSALLEFNKADLIPIYTASQDTFPHLPS